MKLYGKNLEGGGSGALSKKMWPGDPDRKFVYHVIGVVRDFHFESLHDKIEPFAFYLQKSNCSNISIKLRASDMKINIEEIGKKWLEIEVGFSFDFTFLDQSVGEHSNVVERIGKLFIYFSVIAIFVPCLGLFGLASFMAE